MGSCALRPSKRVLNFKAIHNGADILEDFLQWFVAEQVEEEEHVGGVVDDIRRVQNSDQGLLMLDRELGQRQPVEGEQEA